MSKMKEYDFEVHLIGIGETPEDAWEDICQSVKPQFSNPEDYSMPMTHKVISEWDD